MGRHSDRIATLLGFLALSLMAGGCVSLVDAEVGSVPSQSTIDDLTTGKSLVDVLETCGAPLQTIHQREGMLMVYRERHLRFKRFGFEPGLIIAFADITGVLRATLANLKLVLAWGRVDERRLVVLFDQDDRVAAFAYRDFGSIE